MYILVFIVHNISMLQKHFIPKESNNHRPHILRKESIRQILILVIVCEMIAFAGAGLLRFDGTFGTASVIPLVLSDLTNKERQEQNLGALTVNETLNKAAQLKAEDMATKEYFAHTSPEGKTPWYWLKQVGYEYQYAGENLAVDFSDSQDVARAWMNSPTHKANITKQNYTEVGTGVAEGKFEGKKTVYVAQVYANPLVTSANPIVVTPPVIAPPTPVEAPVVVNTPSDQNVPVVQNTEPEVKPVTPVATDPEEANLAPNVVGHNNIGGEGNLFAMNDVQDTRVLGAEISPEPVVASNQANDVPVYSNFLERLIASPHSNMNTLLMVIAIGMGLCLLIYLILRRKYVHMDLITNGLTVIAVVGAIFVVNYFLSTGQTTITQSIDYSNTEVNN